MSVDLLVYLSDDRLPTRDQWQHAIVSSGLDLHLDDFSTRHLSGFLPCRLNGNECGFEYFYGAIEEADDVREEIGGHNRVITFVLHGGQKLDSDAAMLAAAVLTQLCDGVFEDPQSGEFAAGTAVFDIIRRDEQAEHERKRWLAERMPRSPIGVAPTAEYPAHRIERLARVVDVQSGTACRSRVTRSAPDTHPPATTPRRTRARRAF